MAETPEARKLEDRDRNKLVLMSFVNFCAENPDMRFWQALSAWAEGTILFLKTPARGDAYEAGFLANTLSWTGRRK